MSAVAADDDRCSLKNKTVFITGASRGIGRAIALRVAKEGANVVIIGKSTVSNSQLPGSIYSTADSVKALGGKALAIQCDVRFETQVLDAIQKTIQTFGAIDVLVNNASAISLTGSTDTSMKKYDLMSQINSRATFMVSKLCVPYLRLSTNPHILTLCPPLSYRSEWFSPHLAYSLSKFGMSLCVLGLAEELKPLGIAVNALWPKTIIKTSALNLLPQKSLVSRTPEIVADAAYVLLTQSSRNYTGNFTIDEDLLRAANVTNFDQYLTNPNEPHCTPDLFIEPGYSFKLPPSSSKL